MKYPKEHVTISTDVKHLSSLSKCPGRFHIKENVSLLTWSKVFALKAAVTRGLYLNTVHLTEMSDDFQQRGQESSLAFRDPIDLFHIFNSSWSVVYKRGRKSREEATETESLQEHS